MGQSALLFVTAALFSCVSGSLLAQDTAQPPVIPAAPKKTVSEEALNRVVGYTAWDDNYFYLAIQVNKPTVTGTNKEPFSNPLEDDAVLISIQSDNDHKATRRTAHSITVAVSVEGGLQLYTGPNATPLYGSFKEFNDRLNAIFTTEKDPVEQQKKLLALQSTIIKVQVVKKGIARAGGSNAPGYTIEVAIPWVDLGGKPAAGAKMGLNVAAQSKASGSPELQSLSAVVKTAADLDNPSLWGEIIFSNAAAPSSVGALVSPRVFTAKPEISGDLTPGEWNSLSVFSFGEKAEFTIGNASLVKTRLARSRPDYAPRPARPVVLLSPPSVEPLPVSPHQPQQIAPLVMTRYEYRYQTDPRKAAPVEGVRKSDQTPLLAHHPLEGAGPWFSYDRADWHLRQLIETRRAGVDVILPVYRGAPHDRQTYADKGLTVLANALKYLRQSGQDYPQVALFLDTDSLTEVLGEKPDLRDEAAKSALYSMVRDFYRRIPAEFRCIVPLSAQNGGHRAYPVFLSSASPFKDFDATFVTYLRGRFLRDFGADLMVLGDSAFQPKAALDGYFQRAEKGFQFDSNGWLKVATVGPGSAGVFLSDTAKSASDRPRRSGDTYRADWSAAIARHPDVVLLDSWNNFTDGAEIAPSLEEGFSTSDVTRIYTRAFAGSAKFGAKTVWHDAPSVMLSGQTCAVQLRVQNTGLTGWGPTASALTTPVGLAYEWKRNGSVVGAGTAAAVPSAVLNGQEITMTLPVAAAGSGGAGLADGDYILEAHLAEPGRKGGELGAGNPVLQIPVKIQSSPGGRLPSWAATLVRSTLPTMLETGSVYTIDATLRNDGAAPWRKADGTRVTLRLYRTVPTGGADNTALSETPIASADATAMLEQDVAPGQEVTVRLLLPLMDVQGTPLPTWSQEDLWTYTARWEVAAGGARGGARPAADEEPAGTAQGVSFGEMPLAVSDFDFGVRFVTDRTPASLPGDRRLPALITLQNVGTQTWKQDQVRVGYHWYYLDGTELRWEDETTPLPSDLPPGASLKDMKVMITAPPMDGSYYLVWDVKFGDTWASTAASTRALDSISRLIQVNSGRLSFADLTKAYTLDGITESGDALPGDFDGQGRAFPGALLPPFADAPAVPSALWLPASQSGPESPRRISFRWGPKEGKTPNFIVCKGQRLELGKSSAPCRVLHLLAAGTGKDSLESFRLIFQEPTSQSEDQYALKVSRWDRPPTHGEEVAFLARNHYEKGSLQPGAVALYHYAITIREPRKLVSIVLPNAPDIKIAAITLEK